MKAHDLREQPAAELRATELRLRKELFGHRIQNHNGQLADTSQLRKLRRDIARIRGVLSAQLADSKPAQSASNEGTGS